MEDDSEDHEEWALSPYDDQSFDSVSMVQSTVVDSEYAANQVWAHELQQELGLYGLRLVPTGPTSAQIQMMKGATLSANVTQLIREFVTSSPYDEQSFDSISLRESTVVDSDYVANQIWAHELRQDLASRGHRLPPENVQRQFVTYTTLSASDAKQFKVYGIIAILIFTAVATTISIMSGKGEDGPVMQTTTPETTYDSDCEYLKGSEKCFVNKEKRDERCASESCEAKIPFELPINEGETETGSCFCCECDPVNIFGTQDPHISSTKGA